MEMNSLNGDLLHLSTSGYTLSCENLVTLENSLALAQHENHFKKMYLWGRILGVERDYYIAFGYEKDVFEHRKFLYSTNGIDWALLLEPSQEAVDNAEIVVTRFSGDPSHVAEIKRRESPVAEQEEEDPSVPAPSLELKEEQRLSAVIRKITNESAVVPRGALLLRADCAVVENPAFHGLSYLDLMDIHCYLHSRPAREKFNKNLLLRPDYSKDIDFLDMISQDIPLGCWSLQLSAGGSVALLRSLVWPGMTFYHIANTPQYGFLYVGNGRQNLDIPFMM